MENFSEKETTLVQSSTFLSVDLLHRKYENQIALKHLQICHLEYANFYEGKIHKTVTSIVLSNPMVINKLKDTDYFVHDMILQGKT